MLVVKENLQNYKNGAVRNQLTDAEREWAEANLLTAVLRIRITMMLIRILLVTLIRIRILPFTFKRIWIQILASNRRKTSKKCSNK
jgi:hypothetical protein